VIAVLEAAQSPNNLTDAIAKRFADMGGVDNLSNPPREPIREPSQIER